MIQTVIYIVIGLLMAIALIAVFNWFGKNEKPAEPLDLQRQLVLNCGDEALIGFYEAAATDEERERIAGFARELSEKQQYAEDFDDTLDELDSFLVEPQSMRMKPKTPTAYAAEAGADFAAELNVMRQGGGRPEANPMFNYAAFDAAFAADDEYAEQIAFAQAQTVEPPLRTAQPSEQGNLFTAQADAMLASLLSDSKAGSVLLNHEGSAQEAVIRSKAITEADGLAMAESALHSPETDQLTQLKTERARLEEAARERAASRAEARRLAELQAEKERLEAEAAARAQAERERQEAEAAARAQAERERLEAEAAARAQAERERQEAEARRIAELQAEKERLEAEARRVAELQAEKERLEAEAAAQAERERQEAEARRIAELQAEKERLEAEAAAQAERERLATEAAARAQAERERLEAEAAAAAAAQAERERQEAEAAAAAQAERERQEAEARRIAELQAEKERLEAEAAAQAERERQEAEAAAQAERERQRTAIGVNTAVGVGAAVGAGAAATYDPFARRDYSGRDGVGVVTNAAITTATPARASKATVCPHCGSAVESGSTFCIICGLPIDNIPEAALQTTDDAQQAVRAYTDQVSRVAEDFAATRKTTDFWQLDMSKEAVAGAQSYQYAADENTRGRKKNTCAHCGSLIGNGASFCIICGLPVNNSAKPSPTPGSPASGTPADSPSPAAGADLRQEEAAIGSTAAPTPVTDPLIPDEPVATGTATGTAYNISSEASTEEVLASVRELEKRIISDLEIDLGEIMKR